MVLTRFIATCSKFNKICKEYLSPCFFNKCIATKKNNHYGSHLINMKNVLLYNTIKYTKGSQVGHRKIKEANILEYNIIWDKLLKLAICKLIKLWDRIKFFPLGTFKSFKKVLWRFIVFWRSMTENKSVIFVKIKILQLIQRA